MCIRDSHVANANAHHAAVTVQDASLAISGQALRIADAHAGAGLVMSGGIASVNTATAQGTGITSDVVAVVPSGTGGLELSASGVKVKTPTNSGLVVDASGVALGKMCIRDSVGGDTYLETVVDNSVTWTRLISQIGQGAASFYATPGWDDWLTPGRVCVVEKVTNHTDGAARLLACFIIEDIEPKVANGVNVVDCLLYTSRCV